MSIISDAELTRLREAHTATLTTSCEIWRNTVTVNSYGGVSKTWALQATVNCRLMPERDRRLQEILAEREAIMVYYRLTVAWNVDIQVADEVKISGIRYQVVALWDKHDLRTARRAVVVRVT